MDNTAQFVSYLNVTRYLDRLQFERNPTVLTSLQTLLLEEVNKSDFSLDWLGTEQRYAVERIALQKALIGRSTTDGRDMRLARDNRLGQPEKTETYYHCYFLRPVRSSLFGIPSSIAAGESLRAETDTEARMKAEGLYGQQRNHIYGFELWQDNRLVHRRATGNGAIGLSSCLSSGIHALVSWIQSSLEPPANFRSVRKWICKLLVYRAAPMELRTARSDAGTRLRNSSPIRNLPND